MRSTTFPANVPYARYFLARIYQFQFYKAMCDASGYKGPLNRCSFYGSKEAGDEAEYDAGGWAVEAVAGDAEDDDRKRTIWTPGR